MSPMRSTLRISAGRYVVASGITSAPMRLAASHATTHSCPYGEVQADPRALAHARRQHAPGEAPRLLLGLRVRHVPIGRDHEVVVGPVCDRVLQGIADGRAERHRRRIRAATAGAVIGASSAASASASTSSRRSSPGTIALLRLAADERDPDAEVAVDAAPARPVAGRGDRRRWRVPSARPPTPSAEKPSVPTPVDTSTRRSCTHVSLPPADDLLRDRVELADVLVAQREPALGAVDLVRRRRRAAPGRAGRASVWNPGRS